MKIAILLVALILTTGVYWYSLKDKSYFSKYGAVCTSDEGEKVKVMKGDLFIYPHEEEWTCQEVAK